MGTPDMQVLHTREPRFFVVIALPAAGDDWEIRGVLTRQVDAEQLCREINDDSAFLPNSAAIEQLPMSAVLSELLRRARRSMLPPMVSTRLRTGASGHAGG
jgi:hypothetical protein